MKKFIVFALCAISACSVFAEPFSKAKFEQVLKENGIDKAKQYCYEADVSEETNNLQLQYSLQHMRKTTKGRYTKEQLLEIINKYRKSKLTNVDSSEATYMAFGNHLEQAISLLEKLNEHDKQNVCRWIHQIASNRTLNEKNRQYIWKYGAETLLLNGGFNRPQTTVQIINKMFRYRPKTITKQQQIAFLEQLAQTYPIPGTDFNKWKDFMGFVGFKYKALTGKDLF